MGYLPFNLQWTFIIFIFESFYASPDVIDQAQPTTLPWYETHPTLAMDYKIHVDPGKEECYYQYAHPGASFYVSFQVLKGGDGMAGFAVRDPKGELVYPYSWQAQADYEQPSSEGGFYTVCVDNQFSKFSAKLVNIYITVLRYDMWENMNKEIEELHLSVGNFTASIEKVEHNSNQILQYQHHSRSRESRDYNMLLDNNSYVFKWSLFQLFTIFGTSTLQVYFVRKLFEVKNVNVNRRC